MLVIAPLKFGLCLQNVNIGKRDNTGHNQRYIELYQPNNLMNQNSLNKFLPEGSLDYANRKPHEDLYICANFEGTKIILINTDLKLLAEMYMFLL